MSRTVLVLQRGERSLNLSASGDAGRIDRAEYTVRRSTRGGATIKRDELASPSISLAEFDALLESGWSTMRPEQADWPAEFRASVVAGHRYDPFPED